MCPSLSGGAKNQVVQCRRHPETTGLLFLSFLHCSTVQVVEVKLYVPRLLYPKEEQISGIRKTAGDSAFFTDEGMYKKVCETRTQPVTTKKRTA